MTGPDSPRWSGAVDGCALRRDLGAYVLDALPPDERAAVSTHLPDCPACAGELADLAGMADLLDRLSPDEVAALERSVPADPPLGAEFVDRLLAAAAAERALAERRERHRRPQRRLLGAAAAVAVLAAGGGVAADQLTSGGSAPRPGSALAWGSASAGSVRARLVVHPEAWGTGVDLELSGVPPRQVCQLVAVARSGRTQVAASWQATYSGTADVSGATSVPIGRLVAFRVTVGDRVLVSLPAPLR